MAYPSPGVEIREAPSESHAISGVPTAVTVFSGRARRGPLDRAQSVYGLAEFERLYGALWADSMLGYSVQQFFQNGGGQAEIIRIAHPDAVSARVVFPLAGGGNLTFVAANPGSWGNQLRVRLDGDVDTTRTDPGRLFNLRVTDRATSVAEDHLNLSTAVDSERFAFRVLEEQSRLLRVDGPANAPVADPGLTPAAAPLEADSDGQGTDGGPLDANDFIGLAAPAARTGLRLLETLDIFNLVCIPPPTRNGDVPGNVWDEALAHCVRRRAILLVDPPTAWATPAQVNLAGAFGTLLGDGRAAAVYYPRVRLRDRLKDNRLETFVPSGVVAGVIARTDRMRGFWKAPAGIEAGLNGVVELQVAVTEDENGPLNQAGVNCLRSFPDAGRVVWGARTLRGADRLTDQWKYLPVRRTALYIEESLYRGTQWAVFEGNDERLWNQLRMSAGSFMAGLFRQGAFQGKSAREAYFVKCDEETTTEADVALGIVNLHVGFAPLRPAEFVVIRISQMTRPSGGA